MKINDVLLTESTDQLDEIFNPTGLFAGIVRWAVDNPVIIAGLGVAGAGAAVGLTGGAAALGPLISAATGASLGQGAVGLLTLDKLKDIIQSNPNQAENWFKKQIYKYIGDEADAKEFSLLHAKTAYLGKEQMFRWRAKEWPVTMKRDEAEAFLEKTEKFWLDSEKQKAIDAEKANTDAMPANQDGTNKVAEGLTRGVDAKGRTQEKWLALVKAKFPPGGPVTVTKLIQAKMIDGPIIAYLSNGKQIGWKKVEPAITEGVAEATGDEKFDTMMGQIQREPKYPDSQMPPTDVKDLYNWAVENNKLYHEIFAEWANREGYKSVAPALQRAGDLDTEALDYWTPRVWKIYWGEVRGIDSEMPPEWAKKRVPDELRDYLETVFDAYDRIVFDWPTEYRQIGGQDNYAEAKGDYVPPKEANYDDKYQAMVKRVGEKARAQEKAKQQQQPKAPVRESRLALLKQIIQS